jgi:2,5-dichloro-2,5-cyclohexadiene-1,4-diol dehydrogenase 1
VESLEGKSVLITGAGSGIGAAAAVLAGGRGALVTVVDVDSAGGEDVVRRITDAGGTARFVRVDISDDSAVADLVAGTVREYGRLDRAFNNAGIPAFSHRGAGTAITSFADLPLDEVRRNVEVNLLGTFSCMKHEIAAMLSTGGGAIVNTSSGAGILAVAGAGDYVASKHGVVGLTKAAALDYAARGIRVNAVLPGVIRTAMVERSFEANPELVDWASQMQPNKRLGTPEEVAVAALWLLSDEASLVTGIAMPVDGGFSMV